jgi:hypothetical protein
MRQRPSTSASVENNDATGDKFNPRVAPLFFVLLSGSAVALELLPEPVEVGGGGGLEVDGDPVAVSPTPSLPPAVRGTNVGLLVSSATF